MTGGWLLAAQWAGIDNVFTCEIDDFCNKVLDKHFPDTDRHYDIKETDFTKYRGAVDILSTSDPCQPFSFAGKRGGKADDRYLWPQTIRVIREVKPSYVVFENVPGFISLGFETVASDLEAEGYTVESFIIPACSIGAWHRRDRLWIIAYNNSNGWAYRGTLEQERQSKMDKKQHTEASKQDRKGWKCEFGKACQDVSDSKSRESRKSKAGNGRQGISGGGKETGETISDTSEYGCKTRGELSIRKEIQQPFTISNRNIGQEWESESNVGRVVARFSSTLDETINDYGYNTSNKKTISEIDKFRREILREMWDQQCEIKQTSHRSPSGESDDIMYEMSCLRTYERWKLGQRIKENKDLSDVWQRILSKPFKETQNLQSRMLERIGEIECNEKVASSRKDRLKSLGNAIVPQIALIIFEAIKQHESTNIHKD